MSGRFLSRWTAFLAALMAAGFASCAEGAFISGGYPGAAAGNQSSAPPLRHGSEAEDQVWGDDGTASGGCGMQANQVVRESSGSGIFRNLGHLLGGPGLCVALQLRAMGKVINPVREGPLKPPRRAVA